MELVMWATCTLGGVSIKSSHCKGEKGLTAEQVMPASSSCSHDVLGAE
jgi:hypothetical protein